MKKVLIVKFSDVLVYGLSITFPLEDVGEYSISSIEELEERFLGMTFKEIEASGTKIHPNESIHSFISANGNNYEMHRLFEIVDEDSQPNYVTSYLVCRS